MKYRFIAIALVALMQGCATHQSQYSTFGLGDFMNSALKELPYDSPPQVIYRIDNHRFVTLERYRDCHHGETYYNDTHAGIRKYLGRGLFENFQGRVINADPTGKNMVFPLAYPNGLVCGNGERGCVVPFWYSTDGGRTFATKVYMDHSFNAFEDSKDYTFVITSDSVFISQRISKTVSAFNVDRYPLIPGFVYGVDQLPSDKRIEFDTQLPSKVHTRPGQDHITCDPSIKPTNPDAPLVPR